MIGGNPAGSEEGNYQPIYHEQFPNAFDYRLHAMSSLTLSVSYPLDPFMVFSKRSMLLLSYEHDSQCQRHPFHISTPILRPVRH